jgi:hypothetical protein
MSKCNIFMFNKFILAVLTVFVASLGVSASAQTHMFVLTDSNGCRLFFPRSTIVKQVELGKVAESARCRDGLFDGVMVFGARYLVESSNNPPNFAQETNAGIAEKGYLGGLVATFNQDRLRMRTPLSSSPLRQRGNTSIETIEADIEQLVAAANGTVSAVNRQFIAQVARRWHSNTHAFEAEFARNWLTPVRPTIANDTTDDPKVRGRSARGG